MPYTVLSTSRVSDNGPPVYGQPTQFSMKTHRLFSTYPTTYNMFKFIAFIVTVLAHLSAIAASPAAVPRDRVDARPTGFNMCVVST